MTINFILTAFQFAVAGAMLGAYIAMRKAKRHIDAISAEADELLAAAKRSREEGPKMMEVLYLGALYDAKHICDNVASQGGAATVGATVCSYRIMARAALMKASAKKTPTSQGATSQEE